ncbi:hypothetical protein [Leptospira fletcheri]|nr:hypothetical protein [Leptospira fletcheri]
MKTNVLPFELMLQFKKDIPNLLSAIAGGRISANLKDQLKPV